MKFGLKKFKLKKDKPETDLKLTKVEEPVEQPVAESTIENGQSDAEKVIEYNELQNEYHKNPTPELAMKLTTLYGQLYNVDLNKEEHGSGESAQQIEGSPEVVTPATIPEVPVPEVPVPEVPETSQLFNVKRDGDQTTPIEIPDEIPTNANLSEVELEKLAQDTVPVSSDTEEKEKEYVDYLWKLYDDEVEYVKEENRKNIITKQLEQQPEIQLRRLRWRETIPDLEDFALEQFIELMNDVEYEQSYTENVLEEFDEENKEDEESETKANAKKLAEETFAKLEEDYSDEQHAENKMLELDDDPVDNSPKEHEGESFVVPEDDLIAPADLDPELKKVWSVLPRANQEEILKKHKDQVEEKIVKKKKSVFGNKINFSLKRKQLKKPQQEKKKGFLAKLLKKDPNDLKSIEAYCNICKHDIMSHQTKGKSSGCNECGCLTTVQTILEVNKVDLKLDYREIENTDTGLSCKCGHREIVHKERGFCEEKDCYCLVFQNIEIDS